jgi:hypothetical protein
MAFETTSGSAQETQENRMSNELIRELVEALERGIDMLAMLFDKYENGPSCYEEPDESAGYLGNAVKLCDADFHSIADFLNKHRPVIAAQESP